LLFAGALVFSRTASRVWLSDFVLGQVRLHVACWFEPYQLKECFDVEPSKECLVQ